MKGVEIGTSGQIVLFCLTINRDEEGRSVDTSMEESRAIDCLVVTVQVIFKEIKVICNSIRDGSLEATAPPPSNLSLRNSPSIILPLHPVAYTLHPSTINTASHPLSPPPRIHPNHKLLISLRHNTDIPVDPKSIIELPRRFRRSMLDIPHFTIYPNLHPRSTSLRPLSPIFCPSRLVGIRSTVHRRFSVGDRGLEIKHAAHRDRILKGARIQG